MSTKKATKNTQKQPAHGGCSASPCSSSSMIVMPSSNTGFECGRLFGAFPHRMAHLIGADDKRNPPTHRYAIDNGIFGAVSNKREWSPEPFFGLLETIAQWIPPMWVVVPDAMGDKDETLRRWKKYAPTCRLFDVPLAFAAQDGMTPADVPDDADVVFIGGGTEWKWRNVRSFAAAHPRVHVGRVNTYRLLWMADKAGAESCDGTGWFRGDQTQIAGLWKYLKESENGGQPQQDLFDALGVEVENSTGQCPTIGESAA